MFVLSQAGSFEVVRAADPKHGNVMRQMVRHPPLYAWRVWRGTRAAATPPSPLPPEHVPCELQWMPHTTDLRRLAPWLTATL